MAYQTPYETTSTQYQNFAHYNPYTDGDQNQPMVSSNSYPPIPSRRLPAPTPLRRESSGFEVGEFSTEPNPLPGSKSRSVKAMKYSRYGQGNLCTKGGRVRCIGRICCCSLMTTVFLIVSIVLALALFIRPPSITIGSVQPLSGSVGSSIQDVNGISIQLGVDISVENPNYFSVEFDKIEAQLFYPINNTPVGGGSLNKIIFKSHSRTNFTFPFTLSYNATGAQADAIISDLANKCGVTGGKRSNLNIDYKITLGLRIVMATIFPVIANRFSFPCPISNSEITQLLKGLNLGRDLE